MSAIESNMGGIEAAVSEWTWSSPDQARAVTRWLHQALSSTRQPPLVITGESGTGKSTFARRLADLLGSRAVLFKQANISPAAMRQHLGGGAKAKKVIIMDECEQTSSGLLDEIQRSGSSALVVTSPSSDIASSRAVCHTIRGVRGGKAT